MAYCTANDDVKVLTGFYSAYSSSTAPSLTDVTTIISEIEGEINAYLYAAGISTINSTNNNNLLKRFSCIGSAGMVLSRWAQNPNDREQGIIYLNEYNTFVDKLVNSQNYINIFIQNENLANEANLVNSAVTTGFRPNPPSQYINGGKGYINERFTY